MNHRPSDPTFSRGFSLVETLIVIALIAMIGGSIMGGQGMFGSGQLRATAGLIIRATKVAMAHANTTGMPTRVVFDLTEGRVIVEETDDAVYLEQTSKEDREEPTDAKALESKIAEKNRLLFDGPKVPPPMFNPIEGWTESKDDAAKGREIGKGVMIDSVHAEHEEEAIRKGKAYIYFWPGGGAERAVIQLSSRDNENGHSIIISALTGRAEMKPGRVKFEQGSRNPELGEREL